MNITRALLAILLIGTLTGFTSEVKSQTFEGVIVYKTTVEQSEDSDIPEEQFKMMFRGMNEESKLYLKGNKYRLVDIDAKTNKPANVTLCGTEKGKIYSFKYGQNELGMVSDIDKMNLPEPVITKNNDEPLTVMGKKCYSITIDYGKISKSTIYFSNDYKVDVEAYKNNPIGFLQYIYRTGALPLKIYISGGGALQTYVYTAVEVKEESLEDEIFEVPGFMSVLETTF
jgi:hypothetical protein